MLHANNDITTCNIKDKFNIIQNNIIDITDDELTSLIDNYFENIMHSNEKVIHSDMISQILWFKQDFDYSQLILRHLENYLKEKKIGIRNSIKKGVFDIETGLNNLIKNYYDKIYTSFIGNNKEIISLGLSKLYNQIITDPSLLSFLKSEISSLDKNNINSIIKLISVMKDISEVNPEIKSYNWFLFLISSSFVTIIEENNNIYYPVPENIKQIINFRKNLSLYQKITTLYSFVGKDIDIILDTIKNVLFKSFIEIIKTCSMLELYYLITNYKKTFESIFSHENTKNEFVVQFLIFITRNEKNPNFKLENFIKCYQTTKHLFPNSGKPRDFINNKISEILDDDKSQKYLLDIITHNINIQYKTCENNNYLHTLSETQYILSFCLYIKNKDIFMEKYNRMLINRILHNPNILIERNYYTFLYNNFSQLTHNSNKLTYKTNKILTDMENTLEDRKNFSKIINTIKQTDTLNNSVKMICYDIIDKMTVITASYNNWDINQTEGVVNDSILNSFESNSIIISLMDLYNNFYKSTHVNKKKLNWYLHFGEIVFNFNKIEFKMLPIQFIILEHIYNMQEVVKEDLINLSLLIGYNINFKKSIISSLLLGKIIKIENNKIKINTEIDNITTNYIDLFFTSSGYVDIWNNRREQELQLSREEVLSSWITHFLKKESCNKTDLYYKIKKSIDLFDFNIEFLDKVINDMIEKDYIKYNDDKIEKIIW